MKQWCLLFGVLAFIALGGLGKPLSACPLCKEAIEQSAAAEEREDDPLREARAWNASIYLMVSMPYLLLSALGLLIYREYRKKVRAERLAAGERGAGGGEDLSCSDHSPAGTS